MKETARPAPRGRTDHPGGQPIPERMGQGGGIPHWAARGMALAALVGGFLFGYVLCGRMTAGDHFVLRGEAVYEVSVGDRVRYRDEGVEWIYLGFDCSERVRMVEEPPKELNGEYVLAPDGVRIYRFVYEVEPLFGEPVQLLREIRFTEPVSVHTGTEETEE